MAQFTISFSVHSNGDEDRVKTLLETLIGAGLADAHAALEDEELSDEALAMAGDAVDSFSDIEISVKKIED